MKARRTEGASGRPRAGSNVAKVLRSSSDPPEMSGEVRTDKTQKPFCCEIVVGDTLPTGLPISTEDFVPRGSPILPVDRRVKAKILLTTVSPGTSHPQDIGSRWSILIHLYVQGWIPLVRCIHSTHEQNFKASAHSRMHGRKRSPVPLFLYAKVGPFLNTRLSTSRIWHCTRTEYRANETRAREGNLSCGDHSENSEKHHPTDHPDIAFALQCKYYICIRVHVCTYLVHMCSCLCATARAIAHLVSCEGCAELSPFEDVVAGGGETGLGRT